MQMLVPRCHTSLLHFKYMSVSSNESDMHAQAKTNAFKEGLTSLPLRNAGSFFSQHFSA